MNIRTMVTAGFISLGLAVPASAATVSFDILGTISNGIYAGETGLGTITYNDSLISGVGDETLAPVGSSLTDVIEDVALAISFAVGSDVFTQFNDADFPDFPTFSFSDGVLTFIDFVVEDGRNGVDLQQYDVFAGAFDNTLIFNSTENRFEVGILLDYVGVVPVPASLPLLAGALGLLALRRKRSS